MVFSGQPLPHGSFKSARYLPGRFVRQKTLESLPRTRWRRQISDRLHPPAVQVPQERCSPTKKEQTTVFRFRTQKLLLIYSLVLKFSWNAICASKTAYFSTDYLFYLLCRRLLHRNLRFFDDSVFMVQIGTLSSCCGGSSILTGRHEFLTSDSRIAAVHDIDAINTY